MSDPLKRVYDLCVIGCGSAGFAAAMRALDLGKHVCIVECSEIGGAGVMWGALASKTLWELAKDYAIATKRDRGYHSIGLTVDYHSVRSVVLKAVRERQHQMQSQLEAFSPKRYQGPGSITFKRGTGSFTSNRFLRIDSSDNQSQEIESEFFLISTGSSPRRLNDIVPDQEQIFDSDGILSLNSFPKRLMIIGAGVVGCEYATIFSNYGQTEVYLVDHMGRILPFEDEDISGFVQANLEKKGVKILHSAKLSGIDQKPGHVEATLTWDSKDIIRYEIDALLLSIGRTPNLYQLNLQALGLDIEPDNDLPSDKNCHVSRNIYTAGDVSAHPDLVNIAELEGRLAVEHMFGIKTGSINYRNMSTIMFFYPAVAAVGLNERDCREKRIPYRVAYYANALVPRTIAMRNVNGFIKIIVSDDSIPKILGMRAAGPQVSNTIMGISYLINQDKGIADVLKTVHPHPTLSEGVQECIRVLLGTSIYKPSVFPELIKVRTWRPNR